MYMRQLPIGAGSSETGAPGTGPSARQLGGQPTCSASRVEVHGQPAQRGTGPWISQSQTVYGQLIEPLAVGQLLARWGRGSRSASPTGTGPWIP